MILKGIKVLKYIKNLENIDIKNINLHMTYLYMTLFTYDNLHILIYSSSIH